MKNFLFISLPTFILITLILSRPLHAQTTPPTLTAPASSTAYKIFGINYTLPQTPLSGSVSLTFTDGATHTTVLHLADSAAAQVVSFTWDSTTDPILLSQVTSVTGDTSLPVGTYTVTLSYQNSVPNAAATAVSTGVIHRRTTPSPTLTSPTTSSMHSNINLNFTLGATPQAGSVTLTFAGSSTIVLTMNSDTSVNFSLNPTLNPTVAYPSHVDSISGGTFIPAGTYDVTLSYADNLGNPAVTAVATSVVIDTSTQAPTLIKPTSNTIVSDIPINFTLPESALSGSRHITFVSTDHTIVLGLTDATSTDFTLDPTVNPTTNVNIQSTTYSSIPDGTYNVTFSYQDAVGNTASTTTNTGVVVSHAAADSTPTPAATSSGGCSLQMNDVVQMHWGFLLLCISILLIIFYRRQLAD